MRSTPAKDAALRNRLEEAVQQFDEGSADAFGRRIGYANGGYIREVLNGKKPVREALIERFEQREELRGWFSKIIGASSLKTGPDQAPRSEWVAQSMSQSPDTVLPPITWEGAKTMAEFPEKFTLKMPDGALALVPVGTVLVFEVAAQPTPGHGILVEDKEGYRHIRRYTPIRGDHFKAEATAPGYTSFDSITDGLTVLAAVVNKLSDGSV